jgi:thymidine phosphorylase
MPMLFTDVIRTKRDGGELSREQIERFVGGLSDDSLPPEQVSALAMAIFLNSMSFREAADLTTAMASSGTVLDWRGAGLDGPVVDKHSTGGVGDKVSFVLAPLAAACGLYVPMISGRGLGHTGGTLDKVASIPGYDPKPDFSRFREVVREAGCAIIGQTGELAPADRRFYAIRDVTGTVESIPLITASILSKKIAAGLDALVMDVKVGSGAFMKTLEQARALAESLIGTAGAAGLEVRALVTDMNEVLGTTAGNAVEIAESMRYLRNEVRNPRLDEVVCTLCAQMLLIVAVETDPGKALARVEQALVSGQAAERFGRMVSGLGGPADFVERFDAYLPKAKVTMPVTAETSGYLAEVDTFAVGNAVIVLGGGRRKLDDALDLSVGFTDIVPIGSEADAGTPLATVHATSQEAARQGADLFRRACRLADRPPGPRPVIYPGIR